MSKIIGVIDEPVQPGSTDNLDLKIHSKSLIDFVQQTNTPITVGIQGEWGSGRRHYLIPSTMHIQVNRPSNRYGSIRGNIHFFPLPRKCLSVKWGVVIRIGIVKGMIMMMMGI